MTHEAYEQAASYWEKKDLNSVKLDREQLLKAVEAYITANDTCALATGAGEFIRCTPIEYLYVEGAFWLFTEGGEKFKGLEKNNNVCLAIFDKYEGFGKLKGMQVTGKAVLIDPFTDTYVRIAGVKKISAQMLPKIQTMLHLIKVQPEKIEYLNSDFKKMGYDSRQKLIFDKQ